MFSPLEQFDVIKLFGLILFNFYDITLLSTLLPLVLIIYSFVL